MLQRLDVHVQNDTKIRFLFEFQFHFEDASVYKLFFGHKSTDLYQAFLFLSGFCVGVVQKVLKAKTKGSMSTLSYNLHFTPVNKNNKIPKIAICLKEIYTSQKKKMGIYLFLIWGCLHVDTFCIFLTNCLFFRCLWFQGHGVLADILAQMGKAPLMENVGFWEGVEGQLSHIVLLVGAKDN